MLLFLFFFSSSCSHSRALYSKAVPSVSFPVHWNRRKQQHKIRSKVMMVLVMRIVIDMIQLIFCSNNKRKCVCLRCPPDSRASSRSSSHHDRFFLKFHFFGDAEHYFYLPFGIPCLCFRPAVSNGSGDTSSIHFSFLVYLLALSHAGSCMIAGTNEETQLQSVRSEGNHMVRWQERFDSPLPGSAVYFQGFRSECCCSSYREYLMIIISVCNDGHESSSSRFSL